MKAIEKLRGQLQAIGGTLDDTSYALHCDAPPGYVWNANACMGYTIHYATNSQSWLTVALREEMPALKMGLRLATPEELAGIRWDNDDDTIAAPEGAPEEIAWPK